MAFSDVVRKAAAQNTIVERLSDEILSYARLRNAIVHGAEDERVIAEPHDDVTKHIERIAQILTRPPRAAKFAHKVASVHAEQTLSNTIRFMTDGNYSNVPVLENGVIIGVATNKMIVTAIYERLADNLSSFIDQTPIKQILTTDTNHFQILHARASVVDVIACFAQNRKLALLVLTENGERNSPIVGVLTSSDLPQLSESIG